MSLSTTRSMQVLALATALVARPAGAQAAGAMANWVPADAQSITGMIAHHAQAVLIAGWAPTHGASPAVQTMCERIVVGQNDEIAIMQRWLRTRGQPVPDPSSPHAMMPGMDHGAPMPGMLTTEQLTQLDQARGPEFDRLFLTFMIQHHMGAVIMVNQLFATEGAGQDETTFRLASDIYADQTTEIARMHTLMAGLPPSGGNP